MLLLNLAQISAAQNQSAQAEAPHSSRPNVIVLLADDLGWKDIGCYGGPVKTPALDSLAANGIRFNNFYSGAPVCSTARATLMTGRHHLRTGVYTVIQDHLHDMHLLESEVTIAEILKSNGYETVHLGKWHLGTPFRGRKKPWIDEHGFDYWFATDLNAAPSHRDPVNFWRNRKRVGPLKGYACQLVVDEAITWLEQKHTKEKPYFLNIWFHEPHAPLAAPDELVSKYGQLNDPAAIYSATIDNTDRAISRLMAKLKKIGSLDNTIVIYMSDHGSYRHERNGGLRSGKGSLLEGGIRTPGIFSWPARFTKNQVNETPASSIDILPTLCGLIGINKPEDTHLDGIDLSPLLLGKSSKLDRDQPLTWHSPTSQPVVVIRDGQYSLVGFRNKEYPKDKKAIASVMSEMRVILEKKHDRKLSDSELWHKCYNSPLKTPEWNKLRSKFVTLNTFQESWIPTIKSGTSDISRFELYDLTKDPGQTKNIANQQAGVFQQLKKKVLSIDKDVREEAPLWGNAKGEQPLSIHRLKSKKRSRFDAFVYVNRIPIEPEEDESPEDLAGRILGRLANQEGRILIKLPPGMNRQAYRGFKVALANGAELHSGRCFQCHRLPDLGSARLKPRVTTLRNRSISMEKFASVLSDKTHRDISLDKNDIQQLYEFCKTLIDVPGDKFRDHIIKSAVLDTSGDKE